MRTRQGKTNRTAYSPASDQQQLQNSPAGRATQQIAHQITDHRPQSATQLKQNKAMSAASNSVKPMQLSGGDKSNDDDWAQIHAAQAAANANRTPPFRPGAQQQNQQALTAAAMASHSPSANSTPQMAYYPGQPQGQSPHFRSTVAANQQQEQGAAAAASAAATAEWVQDQAKAKKKK
ncbi:hypothetical protein [Spongiibacter tropicus]|uniref:hypothetical protein n=1 Tax=Spongiibacter tropicus TaxID=454602 RepID=UPI0024E1F799|nr:hypothetical protein [Spongiibacter tropicus]